MKLNCGAGGKLFVAAGSVAPIDGQVQRFTRAGFSYRAGDGDRIVFVAGRRDCHVAQHRRHGLHLNDGSGDRRRAEVIGHDCDHLERAWQAGVQMQYRTAVGRRRLTTVGNLPGNGPRFSLSHGGIGHQHNRVAFVDRERAGRQTTERLGGVSVDAGRDRHRGGRVHIVHANAHPTGRGLRLQTIAVSQVIGGDQYLCRAGESGRWAVDQPVQCGVDFGESADEGHRGIADACSHGERQALQAAQGHRADRGRERHLHRAIADGRIAD